MLFVDHFFFSASFVRTCTEGAIRLQGGQTTYGRVELCLNGNWGTICDNRWDNVDAGVACRHLGFNAAGKDIFTAKDEANPVPGL